MESAAEGALGHVLARSRSGLAGGREVMPACLSVCLSFPPGLNIAREVMQMAESERDAYLERRQEPLELRSGFVRTAQKRAQRLAANHAAARPRPATHAIWPGLKAGEGIYIFHRGCVRHF